MTVTPSAEPHAEDAAEVVAAAASVRAPVDRPMVPRVVPNPKITRPHGLSRAARPGAVPAPEHRHLPGWVRRAHGQAQPILADLLGLLEGEHRAVVATGIDQLVSSISAGRFSQAWSYPKLIAEGMRELTLQKREVGEFARSRQRVEVARRRVADQIRDNATRLPGDAASRLGRSLRSATDIDAISAIGSEVERAVGSLRVGEERRREREIGRTRARIRRSTPRSVGTVTVTETWQETLRRFAEQQAAGVAEQQAAGGS